MAKAAKEVWFGARRYQFDGETVRVLKQRGATRFWSKIKDDKLAAAIRSAIAVADKKPAVCA